MLTYFLVVIYCHSVDASKQQFLFRLQDENMTNGDYVFFTFAPNVATSVLQPWASWNLSKQDAAYRKTLFGAVKQVQMSQCVHYTYLSTAGTEHVNYSARCVGQTSSAKPA